MSEALQVFRIRKTSGTHADVFAAAGLADLLASVPELGEIRLIEYPGEFQVRLSRPLNKGDLARIPQTPGYPFLKTKGEIPDGVKNYIDYAAEKAKAGRRRQTRGSRQKARLQNIDPETQQLMQQDQPHEDWRLFQVLNVLQGDENTNKIHESIRRSKDFHGTVFTALDALTQQRASGVGWKASLVQLFTPLAAKGYSRLKPDSTDRNDKTKDQWADGFLEWLKYRGYFRIACPMFLGSDIRLMCPVPRDISVQALESVARKLRQAGVFGGAPKVDALTVLRLADLLIVHSEEYHDPGSEVLPGLSLRGRTPADAISAIMITHYQSLGSAKAISAMSALALPGWFRIDDRQDAEDLRAILAEHQRIVRALQDDHSDEIGLLIAYRRVLGMRGAAAVWALLEFMERYGSLMMRVNGTPHKGKTRWMPRFTDAYLRRIIMSTDQQLANIVNDPGFEAVARAVRQATITAQHQRARGGQVWREIRYELLHDLHRTRKVPGNAFIECVTEFVSRYNLENARRRETTKNPRAAPPNISDDELKQFLALVDHYGASLVGALLAAYGSCKEKWEPEDGEGQQAAAGTQSTAV